MAGVAVVVAPPLLSLRTMVLKWEAKLLFFSAAAVVRLEGECLVLKRLIQIVVVGWDSE